LALISQILKAENVLKEGQAGGVAQVIEPLPIKCKALILNPSTAKKKKNRKEG
jgi:hypothetical protein